MIFYSKSLLLIELVRFGVFVGLGSIVWKFIAKIITITPMSGRVAAHVRGMRPTPSTKQDTLMLRKNLNSNTNQTLN